MKIICFHLNQLGDLAFSLPALKCIKDSFQDAVITSVVRPGYEKLLASTGLVDDILIRDSRFFSCRKLELIEKLVFGGYDIAVVFSQSLGCSMLSYSTRAPKRIGFINTSLGFLLTKKVDFNHPPSTSNNLRLIDFLGCKKTCDNYAGLIIPTAGQIACAEDLLRQVGVDDGKPIVAFAPGTSGRRSVKEWSGESFAEVGRHLSDRGYTVLVLGTVPAFEIVEKCPQIIDLSGKTNIDCLLGVLSKCKTIVAVDSGILHLAAAVGVRVVGLYGPSNSDITGPQGGGHVVIKSDVECSPCMKTQCDKNRVCMRGVLSDDVIAAVERILDTENDKV